MTDDRSPAPPLLRVVRGEPDDTELAALAAVVAGLASAASTAGNGDQRPVRRSRWGDPAARMRPLPRPGEGAWRYSHLPGT
ncbi:acyl-CoA carboxylase epsilon subunit-like protein [Prauserella shujinwangii]|uniref:Acyl-CoA carboxylase epsilon subunit-like protein n=1 Tax=Prauserella shujinwangii TaxID=1453103 RepID=A0A2T0LMM3_9PSEU|nr:acyl-CoA carboxylase subunit epsilon [Prauserella shujinwangii]PRX44329.1 acyl-CoA carboxylase epsilon subunit-like protein [Prauserella shujinwangii]